jgi:hypothetical protein
MQHIKRIVIFDWDGTLCISPENTDENRRIWESVTNRKWPYSGRGWWSKPETLDYEVFDIRLNDDVKRVAIESIADKETYTVILTGRMSLFSSKIKEIMRMNGIDDMDAYYFNDLHDTLQFKLKMLQSLKNEFPDVKIMEMWEDRVEHIPYFIEWGKGEYGDFFIMNIVEK